MKAFCLSLLVGSFVCGLVVLLALELGLPVTPFRMKVCVGFACAALIGFFGWLDCEVTEANKRGAK